MTLSVVSIEAAVRKSAPRLRRKLGALLSILNDAGPCVVAFSGGVDSSLLAYVASAVHPETVCAVACSETYTPEERRMAKSFAERHSLNIVEIRTKELANPEFAANNPDRCYHCKLEMIVGLRDLAAKRGLHGVMYGENFSDANDRRPGGAAMRERGALSPLAEAGLTKEDVRAVSKALGLGTWSMPSNACLASRLAYGEAITPDRLRCIAAVERKLRSMGLEQVRARVHGDLLRIEVGGVEGVDIKRLAEAAKGFKKLGYIYVTLDLEGYRTGSMNEAL
jgi:uncharacterized protein